MSKKKNEKLDNNLDNIVKYYFNVLNGKVKGVDYKDDIYGKLYEKHADGIEKIINKHEGLSNNFTQVNVYINKKNGKLSLKKNGVEYGLTLYVLKNAKNKVDELFKENNTLLSDEQSVFPYIKAILDATLLFGKKKYEKGSLYNKLEYNKENGEKHYIERVAIGQVYDLVYDMKDVFKLFQEATGREYNKNAYEEYRLSNKKFDLI